MKRVKLVAIVGVYWIFMLALGYFMIRSLHLVSSRIIFAATLLAILAHRMWKLLGL